jgi:hypothetical protein
MKTKSSTLCIVSRTSGVCADCRHSNQGTADFSEGHVFCQWDRRPKQRRQACDVPAPQMPGSAEPPYWFFERYDGHNCTWGKIRDARILRDDADEATRRELQADRPFIPEGEE